MVANRTCPFIKATTHQTDHKKKYKLRNSEYTDFKVEQIKPLSKLSKLLILCLEGLRGEFDFTIYSHLF